jgi:uncharacterized protein YjbJ (UPF0337 family)
MKPIHWIIAGVGIGLTITGLLFMDPLLKRETGYDGVEDAADEAWGWGTKRRFDAGGDSLIGRVKEGVGRVAGDGDLVGEGVLDQAVGTAKNTAGKLGQTVGKTIHDLNR